MAETGTRGVNKLLVLGDRFGHEVSGLGCKTGTSLGVRWCGWIRSWRAGNLVHIDLAD